VSVFDLSSVPYFQACTDMDGTVQPNCADVPLRIYSLTHVTVSLHQAFTTVTLTCCKNHWQLHGS